MRGGSIIGKFIDLTGQTFGRLTVLRRAEDYIGKTYRIAQWECVCSCPEHNVIVTRGTSLRNGHTQSCGCYHKDAASKANTTHGDTTSQGNKRLLSIWKHMIKRCEDQAVREYKNYGARGIVVCDAWHNYPTFKDWAINNGYEKILTLDRINVNGNYCPENCRWITQKAQANNMRTNRLLTYNGETHTMSEWADIMDIPYQRLDSRMYRGWSVERALTEPVHEWAVRK